MEVNGIAHIYLTVANYDACAAFYRRLLPFIGLSHVVRDTPQSLYCIGGRTGFGITRAIDAFSAEHINQERPGLHHVCFRARAREDIDAVHALVHELGAKVLRAPEEGHWAPGYYSVLFEDPSGGHIEVSYIPGKGLLSEPEKQ